MAGSDGGGSGIGPVRPGIQAPTLPPSLHARLGQLLLVGFRGLTPAQAPNAMRDIREGTIGNVILYGTDPQTGEPKNVRSRAQVQGLIEAIIDAAPIAPIVAVDAEGGGFYQQLKEEHGFPPTIAPAQLGARNDLGLTASSAHVIAASLAGVGATLNLAPVVDLAYERNLIIAARRRSFSPDPRIVTAHARAFVAAHHEAGVTTTLKHFPGIGSSVGKTHAGVADVSSTWSRDELEPYRVLIGEGIADAVLTAHIFHAGLDSRYPASLSDRIVEGVLRRELGFEGLVICDALDRRAICDAHGFERALILALNAGIDLLLLANPSFDVPYSDRRAEEAVAILVRAVERGDVAEARVDAACGRVLELKRRQEELASAAASRRTAHSTGTSPPG